MGFEFDYVQLAEQLAPGEREEWNADALMEGVRVGSGRADFLAALEDRVKTEEAQWSPLLQLHYPNKLGDYLNKVLVETGERFFKKEPMDAPGYSDFAAKRRELLSQWLEARKSIGVDRLRGQDGLGRLRSSTHRKPNGGGRSQPEPSDWLHGYIPGRRRESAVLIRQVGQGHGCWGRMLSLDSRDTGWRQPRF